MISPQMNQAASCPTKTTAWQTIGNTAGGAQQGNSRCRPDNAWRCIAGIGERPPVLGSAPLREELEAADAGVAAGLPALLPIGLQRRPVIADVADECRHPMIAVSRFGLRFRLCQIGNIPDPRRVGDVVAVGRGFIAQAALLSLCRGRRNLANDLDADVRGGPPIGCLRALHSRRGHAQVDRAPVATGTPGALVFPLDGTRHTATARRTEQILERLAMHEGAHCCCRMEEVE